MKKNIKLIATYSVDIFIGKITIVSLKHEMNLAKKARLFYHKKSTPKSAFSKNITYHSARGSISVSVFVSGASAGTRLCNVPIAFLRFSLLTNFIER